MNASSAPAHFVDKEGNSLELLLYKRDSCWYCQRVLQRASELGLYLRTRDTLVEAGARDELIEKGGKPQVPCLFIGDRALYESSDIIRFLEELVAQQG